MLLFRFIEGIPYTKLRITAKATIAENANIKPVSFKESSFGRIVSWMKKKKLKLKIVYLFGNLIEN